MILRLIYGVARPHWAIMDGESAMRGVDLIGLPLSRFLNVCYWYMVRYADEKEKAKQDRQLWMPPKGVAPAPESPWAPENETAAFGSLATALGVSTGKPKAKRA